jgi:hypothetical protein
MHDEEGQLSLRRAETDGPTPAMKDERRPAAHTFLHSGSDRPDGRAKRPERGALVAR